MSLVAQPNAVPSMSSALAQLSPANLILSEVPDLADGRTLEGLFQCAEDAQMRIIVLGLYAFGIKSRLPHGAFGDWLARHAPTLARVSGRGHKPKAALSSYMQLTGSVLEAMGITLSDWFPGLDTAKRNAGVNRSALPWEPHQLLLFPEAELDANQRLLRNKLHDVIAGNSKKALVAKFVTYKEDDETIVPKTGAGVYHATKADGVTPRAPKRTYAQKQADEAVAAAASLKVMLMQWRVAAAVQRLKLLPAAQLQELRGYTADLLSAINGAINKDA